jgi:hypothetical protein
MSSVVNRFFWQWILSVLIIAIIVLLETRRWNAYPYGNRVSFMRVTATELMNYASRHDGWFPSGKDEYSGLAQLWPGSPCGPELAGLSGDIAAVTNALQVGRSLSNVTSWHYVPGLKNDDNPGLAILWESKFGLSEGGKRIPQMTRSVLLVDYRITNILDTAWPTFLKDQEQLWSISFIKHRDATRGSSVNPTGNQ